MKFGACLNLPHLQFFHIEFSLHFKTQHFSRVNPELIYEIHYLFCFKMKKIYILNYQWDVQIYLSLLSILEELWGEVTSVTKQDYKPTSEAAVFWWLRFFTPPLHLEGCKPGTPVDTEELNVLAADDQH